jgi:flagellar operon protein
MDIKTLNPNIAPVGGQGPATSGPRTPETKGSSFREALKSIGVQGSGLGTPDSVPGISTPLKFSNHAVERMQRRGISYSPEQMTSIEKAIDKAAAKGSRETLLLTDESAMIVSVNNRTVVTVMDKNSLKENVFTNIDSTVVI